MAKLSIRARDRFGSVVNGWPSAISVPRWRRTHTDIPWAELVDEAARLLPTGGSFIYVGGDPGQMPAPSPDGVRTRVGARVLTRPELLAPLTDDQWNVETITTAAVRSVPMVGWRATRR